MRTNNIDLSIITIVNKENIYNEFLEDLKSQEGVKFELIPIFNLDNKCESARELFNHAAQRCKGKWLCFSHPDIRLLSNTALKNILDEANSILATRGGADWSYWRSWCY